MELIQDEFGISTTIQGNIVADRVFKQQQIDAHIRKVTKRIQELNWNYITYLEYANIVLKPMQQMSHDVNMYTITSEFYGSK